MADSNAEVTDKIRNQIIDIFQRVSTVAEKGVIIFLLAMGGTLFITALILRIGIDDHKFSNLSQAEFITIFIIAFLLILIAAGIKLYLQIIAFNLSKNQQRLGAEILGKVTDSGTKLAETSNPINPDKF